MENKIIEAISPMILKEIEQALANIETEHHIQILYACESGSRAWGFASDDSDYDVRFIYQHHHDWYLQLFSGKDTIDRMLPYELDLTGWDLRKSLQLLAKSNIGLYGWLTSDIIYQQNEQFMQALNDISALYFNPVQGIYHYLGLARKTYEKHLKQEQVNLKKLFYFIRPIFSCAWIEQTLSVPPTAFQPLWQADWISDYEKQLTQTFLALKQGSRESDLVMIDAELQQWMVARMAHFKLSAAQLPKPVTHSTKALDQLFMQCLGNSQS